MVDHTVIEEARRHLMARASALSQEVMGPNVSLALNFSEVRSRNGQEELADCLRTATRGMPTKAIVYRISVPDSASTKQLIPPFTAFKALKTHKLPRMNRGKEHEDSKTLYVGSSVKTPGRIKEHIYGAYSGTYALNLASWLPDISAELKIEIYGFREEVTASIVQDIEDAWWRLSTPLLGRYGPR